MGWSFPECDQRKRLQNSSYAPSICLLSVEDDMIYECGERCRSGKCPKGKHEVKG